MKTSWTVAIIATFLIYILARSWLSEYLNSSCIAWSWRVAPDQLSWRKVPASTSESNVSRIFLLSSSIVLALSLASSSWCFLSAISASSFSISRSISLTALSIPLMACWMVLPPRWRM